jgi:hypothetical protein
MADFRTSLPSGPKETEPKGRARTAVICLAATPPCRQCPSLSVRLARTARYTRASPSMQKVLAVDCLPQAVVVLDEGSDEFMQAGPGYCDVILRRYEPRAGMKCATSSTQRISAASIVALRSSHISRYDHWECDQMEVLFWKLHCPTGTRVRCPIETFMLLSVQPGSAPVRNEWKHEAEAQE